MLWQGGLSQQAVPTAGSATAGSSRHPQSIRGWPSPMMCEGRLCRGHMRVSQSSVPRVILTGEKRNSYCSQGIASPQTSPPLPGKATNSPGQLEVPKGNRRGVADLLPAGAKGGVRGDTRTAQERKELGSCEPPLGKIQRALRGCIRDAWVGIPQVAPS